MKTTNKKIAGALFDFVGYLTSMEKAITFGCKYNVPEALECLSKWAEERKFDLDDADVKNWNK